MFRILFVFCGCSLFVRGVLVGEVISIIIGIVIVMGITLSMDYVDNVIKNFWNTDYRNKRQFWRKKEVYCPRCMENVNARKAPLIIRNIILSIITLGLWILLWVCFIMEPGGWICPQCGKDVHEPLDSLEEEKRDRKIIEKYGLMTDEK